MAVYLTDLGLVNALGAGQKAVSQALFASERALALCDWVPGRTTYTAPVTADLAPLPPELQALDCRNARLAATALEQISSTVELAVQRYGAHRVAVVAGTSTSGIAEGEAAIKALMQTGELPADYHYSQQEIGNLCALVSRLTGAAGPSYTLSTACSSSAHALGSAKRLLDAGLADAVIAGGADSLCRLTVNGFAALESVSPEPCQPFSVNRSGINIGEAAAFFLVTREPLLYDVALLGVGASSDAHHISAPDPTGAGAEAAIRAALASAGCEPYEVDYINLHGTGTPLNDAMESAVVARLFSHQPLCSSSKGQLGHTLGAAGATEAALCWLALTESCTPPHVWDNQPDPALPELYFAPRNSLLLPASPRVVLSNSFAFGGNNAAVLLGDARS
ncbi:beta-ketoacyl-ACP synthase [uncultured Gilvimarinus sp.]|uniref:beta-ketoacyl-ACP synthase n=1 Tax=uncultured Gilvimarinus sp. TaxID=1689143 RepID=UPI0030EE71A7|tara:strand:+ start:761 stop:1939 length:1179 start_codon:yes stop_codon:yes gene_type:complete